MTIAADYEERVYAGVLGKLIGVYLGRPFEGWEHARIMRELGPVAGYLHERFGVPLVVTDDDIAGTFTFVRALEDHGFDPALDAARIGETWLNYIVEKRTILWWGGMGCSTEETAWRRLRSGVPAPLSGAIATNGRTVAEQIGAQIFIDGWAMVSPGDPGRAAHRAREAARVSHDGEAVHAAVLIAVMESLAFIDADLDRLLAAGLAAVPADCLIARVAADVRRWCAANADWRATRALIAERYGYDRYPGNCHVIPNHAVVLMALLYGRDDFGRAMMVANSAGWDTDCNAGNVGCLMGIRLGLAGLQAGPDNYDWRGPIADRVIISSADGGNAITDAVCVAERLARIGRRLAGAPERPRAKGGARFHFSFPGSVQGFAGQSQGQDGSITVTSVLRDGGEHGLALRFCNLPPGGTVTAETPSFIPPDVALMRTYELLASPTLHPGQVVRARLVADTSNNGTVDVTITLLVYGADDALERLDGPPMRLAGGGTVTLCWTVPDLGGRPAAAVGVAMTNRSAVPDGVVYLDWLDWQGTPNVVLRRPEGAGCFWRRAWVDAVSDFGSTPSAAFQLSQTEGRGLLIYGARDWVDVRVESELSVQLGDGGLAICVQGLRRYYALVLRHSGRLALLKVWDGEERILDEAAFDWAWDQPVRLGLAVRDGALTGLVGGRALLQVRDVDRPLLDGAVALVIERGALSTSSVRIRAA